ncbi:hypothetical protein WICMUC_005284 [Wickerhamomyces mucosus]|uniref:Uncharacterized protein n=1 Tax=Wickerhamomyces mucosus TaxID=1378264 RepID=A0A9P8PAF5_9ASCO|nr:hypothetical protein WICMUC_005284 [Wickerhamomyces mucosus]
MRPEFYLLKLLQPIFSNLLSMKITSSISDLYILEWDSVLWRTVIGLFNKIEYKYGSEKQNLNIIGWGSWDGLDNNNEVSCTSLKENKYLKAGDDNELLDTI